MRAQRRQAMAVSPPTPRRSTLPFALLCLLAAGWAGAIVPLSAQARPARRYAHVRLSRVARLVVPPALPRRPLLPPKPKPAPRPPSAAALYERSLNADDIFSYRGRQITTYWRSGRATAVLVMHRAPSLRRIDYLAPDAQRGRSLVTDERQEWQFDPQSKRLLHHRRAANAEAVEDAAASYDLLRTNYILQVLPQPRVYADRKAFVVTLSRKAGHTVARRLWIDAATGLVLKRENYREDGKLALTVAFSDISFRAPLSKSLFDLSALIHRPGVRLVEEKASGETTLPLSAVQTQLGGHALAPPTLAGYRLVSAALARNGVRPLLHLRYSDGLNLVSLFELPRSQTRKPTRVPPSMRPVQIGRSAGHVSHRTSLTTFNWDKGPLNLTLMGEIAEPTLQALAQAADGSAP